MEGDDSNSLIAQLTERAKELTCLYKIEELLKDYSRPIEEVLQDVVEQLPPAWEFPSLCSARITLYGTAYDSPGFKLSSLMLNEPITVQGDEVGRIQVA